MHFIDEQQCALTGRLTLGGAGKHLAKVGNPVENRRYGFKGHPRLGRQKPRNSRLAGAGRAPEDDRGQLATIQLS